jgi:type II secretory pathway pseudopilin PulG
MNTLTPLNPDVKPDALPENPRPEAPVQSSETLASPQDYVDYNIPAIEVEQPSVQPASYTPVTPVTPTQAAFGVGAVSKAIPAIAFGGFLMKYIASLFAGISVLYGLSSLGFALLDHFINQPAGVKIGSLFNASSLVSTWHVWLVASLLTFAVLYLTLSRSAGKYIAGDLVSKKELQVAEVARAIFTAILIISATSLMASLVFTLLNGTLAAADIDGKDIAIQVVGSILAFAWIGILVWHQTSIHLRGKNGVAGAILTIGVALLAVLASVFLLATGRNAVIDSRTVSDLSTVQSALMSYKSAHDDYPEKLSVLTIEDEAVKGRLAKYTYTRTEATKQASLQQKYSDMIDSGSMYDSLDTLSDNSTSVEPGYKLCANFLTDASASGSSLTTQSYSSTSTFYSHGKGEHCVDSAL